MYKFVNDTRRWITPSLCIRCSLNTILMSRKSISYKTSAPATRLNTHHPGSFYDRFDAVTAHQLINKVVWHYTPPHWRLSDVRKKFWLGRRSVIGKELRLTGCLIAHKPGGSSITSRLILRTVPFLTLSTKVTITGNFTYFSHQIKDKCAFFTYCF